MWNNWIEKHEKKEWKLQRRFVNIHFLKLKKSSNPVTNISQDVAPSCGQKQL